MPVWGSSDQVKTDGWISRVFHFYSNRYPLRCVHGYRQPSAQQLQRRPSFDAAVWGDKRIKRKSIVPLLRPRDCTDLPQYRSKSYRSKEAVIDDMEGEWKSSFLLLPLHLVQLRRVNLDIIVKLKVDQHNRFLWLWCGRQHPSFQYPSSWRWWHALTS